MDENRLNATVLIIGFGLGPNRLLTKLVKAALYNNQVCLIASGVLASFSCA